MYLDGSVATYQADRQVIDFVMIIILSSYSFFTSSPLSIRQQTNRRMNGWMEGCLFLRRICLHFILVAFVECTERVVTRAKRSLGLTIFEEAGRGRNPTGPRKREWARSDSFSLHVASRGGWLANEESIAKLSRGATNLRQFTSDPSPLRVVEKIRRSAVTPPSFSLHWRTAWSSLSGDKQFLDLLYLFVYW